MTDKRILGLTQNYRSSGRTTEDELREANDYLEKLLDNASALIVVWDPHRRIIRFNRAFEKLTGYQFAEINCADLSILFPKATHKESLQKIATTRSGSRWDAVEIPILCKNEEVRTVLWNSANIYKANNKTLVATIAQGQDITQRKVADEALRESVEKYKTLVESAPVGVVSMDLDGRLLTVNHTMLELCTQSKIENMIGQSYLNLITPEDRQRAQSDIETARLKSTMRGSEYQFLSGSQKTFSGMVFINLLCDNFGFPKGYLAIIQDVTTHKRLEDQFRGAQKMEAVGRLAGGIAHDFNNLLTVILSFSGFVKNSLPENDPAREDVIEIENAANRAVGLTRQLLAYSRKSVVRPETLNINTALANLEKMLKRLLGEDISVTFKLEGEPRWIEIDPGYFDQIVFNIAVNARDAMPDGGNFTIETNITKLEENDAPWIIKPGSYVCMILRDTGIGIPEEAQPHIFEPFFTTKEKGKGTGLGLSTVYGLVKQAGGHIMVKSKLQQGTTFHIYFPHVVTTYSASIPSLKKESQPHKPLKRTVLVVDDEAGLCKIVRRTLEAQMYFVLEARNGAEALVLTDRHEGKIDLVVTDVIMPLMNGNELASKLRKIHPDIPVLFMSGFPDDKILREGVLEPGVHFLQKPFTADGLLDKIEEVMKSRG